MSEEVSILVNTAYNIRLVIIVEILHTKFMKNTSGVFCLQFIIANSLSLNLLGNMHFRPSLKKFHLLSPDRLTKIVTNPPKFMAVLENFF